MLNLELLTVLNHLSTKEYKTANKFAEELSCSRKTARKRISELDSILKKQGGYIKSKPQFGYILVIDDREKFDKFIKQIKAKDYRPIPVTPKERVYYLIDYFIVNEDYITMEELREKLYISRNTLTADLKKVEYILDMYDLELERRPNYGIRLKGKEFDKRVCIANTYRNNSLFFDNEKMEEEQAQIGKILFDLLNRHNIRVPEISFKSIVLHIYISKERMLAGVGVKLTKDIALRNVSEDIYNLAVELSNNLEKEMDISLNEGEIAYLSIHLAGKISSDSSIRLEENLSINEEIDDLTTKILNAIYDGFKIDLRDDFELRMGLNQHLVPFDIRMEYGIPLQNPILENIKREYSFSFNMAIHIGGILSEHYNKAISEDELGYFAVLFELALEKRDRDIKKKNIVIVCGHGIGSSQLFIHRYKQTFGRYIDNIYETTVFELEDFDFKKVDYVFTTVPIRQAVPVPVFELDLFFEADDVARVSEVFERGNEKYVERFFSKELFFTGIKEKTKEEILKCLCDKSGEVHELSDGFYESVLKREELGQTDFGNYAAIPHPFSAMSKESFVTVGILEKPIWWGNSDVQVVFLLSISKKGDDDIQRLYQLMANILFDKDKMERLIKNPNYDFLMELLTLE